MARAKPLIEIGKEGWLTTEPHLFHMLLDENPPRRYTYRAMLLQDLREPKLWLVWGKIVFFLALSLLSILSGLRVYALLGLGYAVYISIAYLVLLRGMVHTLRHEVVNCGIATEAENRPQWWEPNQVILHAITKEGNRARVSLGIAEAYSAVQRYGAIEVLFLQPAGARETPTRHPESAFIGFAYRPASQPTAQPLPISPVHKAKDPEG